MSDQKDNAPSPVINGESTTQSVKKDTRFKPGNKANPLGGKAHDPKKRMLKKVTTEVVQELVELALKADLDALQNIIKSRDEPALKVGIATSLARAIQKGDWGTLQSIIETLTGKAVTRVDLTSGGEKLPAPPPAQVMLYVPSNGKTREENLPEKIIPSEEKK